MANTLVLNSQHVTQQPQLYSYMSGPHLYSDHYPNHRNTPEGTVFIALDRSSQRNLHTCNDLIRGVVRVKTGIKAECIRMRFTGRSACRIVNDVAVADLFHHEKTLLPRARSSSSPPTARHDYPFEFRFPEAVEEDPKLQNNAPWKPDALFEHEKGHPLPPSLWWKQTIVRTEYLLEAEVSVAQSSFSLNTCVRHQLRFSPSVPEQSLTSEPAMSPVGHLRLQRKAQILNPEAVTRMRSPFKMLKDTLHGEKPEEGYANFTVTLNAPFEYRIGTATALSLSLKHTNHSEGIEPPVVTLRGIRVQAIAHIHSRVPNSWTAKEETRKEYSDKFELFNRRFGKPGLVITDDTWLTNLRINELVPPQFKSYGVSLTYHVKYKLWVECAGKESEYEIERQDVRIEPMTRPGGPLGPPEDPPPVLDANDEAIAASRALHPLMMNLHPSDPPPPYSP